MRADFTTLCGERRLAVNAKGINAGWRNAVLAWIGKPPAGTAKIETRQINGKDQYEKLVIDTIDVDRDGNLYLSTGDDTNPFASDGFTPIDERPGQNPAFDAQRTSANTNDLRGKVLRIDVDHPDKDRAYSVPKDNPFVDLKGARPETWAYGFRNLWRLTVDQKTGHIWVAQNGQDLWEQAFLIDAGFTRADGHRLVAEILDSGKELTKVFVSHADPDFYWGAEVVADAFPEAEIVATPLVVKHIRASFEGKLKAWAALGPNLPTRLIDIQPLTGDLTLECHRFELKGGPAALPDRHYLWQAEQRAIVGGVLLFQNEHVWVADTAEPEDRAVWIEVLDEMSALDPAFAVPGHRLPTDTLDASPIAYTRDYLIAFEAELDKADSGEALTKAMVSRYPGSGMLIAAQLGAKVAKGEMSWG